MLIKFEGDRLLNANGGAEYASAILDAAAQPLAVLDGDFKVAFINDAFADCFGLERDAVLGRGLTELGCDQWNIADLAQLLRDVKAGQTVVREFRLERAAGGVGRRVFILHVRRFEHAGERGILLALTDVTATERLRSALEARMEFAEAIVDSVPEALLVLDHDLRVVSANQVFYDLFRVDAGATEGRLVYELGGGQWNVRGLRKLLEDILPSETAFDDYELKASFDGLGERTMLLNGRRLDHVDQIVLAIRDVTEEYARRQAEREVEARAQLLHALGEVLRTGTDAAAIMATACDLFRRHLGIAAAAFAEMEEGRLSVVRYGGKVEDGAQRDGGSQLFEDLGRELMADLEQGRAVVIGDASSDPRTANVAAMVEVGSRAGALLVVPLCRDGCLEAAFFVCSRDLRTWTAADIALSEEVALRVWATVGQFRAVARLKDSEARMRLAQDVAGIGTWDLDLATDRAEWSATLYDMLGLESSQPASSSLFFKYVHPEDRCRIEARFREAVALGGQFNEEFRIIRSDGAVRIVIGAGKVVQSSAGQSVRMIGVNHDVTPYREAQQRLIEGAERLERAQRAGGVGVWEWRPKTGEVFWSSEARRLFAAGDDTAPTFEHWQSRLHPDDREAACAKAAEALGGATYEDIYRVLLEDGSARWLRASGELERDAGGEPLIMRGVLVDITQQKLHEEHVELLLREMSHRAKNMLALVQAIARQTAARGKVCEIDDFSDRFEKRLQGLAASQDLLIQSDWTGTDLGELVRAQLAHFADLAGERIKIEGPAVVMSASAVQAIGMAIHELATNAAKYGALSNEQGLLDIAWRHERRPGEEATFEMSWSERGGPPVQPPDRAGFGSVVLKDMIEYSLGAEVEVSFSVSGLGWRMRCPFGRVGVGPPEGRAADDAATVASKDPDGTQASARQQRAKVLVVEDETLLAFEIAGLLAGAGFDVIGPATTVAEARRTIETRACDAAVLDVHLSDGTTEPIARELVARSVPVVAITSYALAQLPDVFREARVLAKPVRLEKLLVELRACLRNGNKSL